MRTLKFAVPGMLLNFVPAVMLVILSTGFILPADKAVTVAPAIFHGSEATPESTQTITHKDIPGSPVGKIYQTVYDQTDEKTASQKQAFGGDDFNNGKYERPFDQDMNYIPQIDLVSVQLNREDPLWVYVLFEVDRAFSDNPDLNPHFLIEIDQDLDNRGDVLIVTGKPISSDWSTESVAVLTNPDLNVGGVKPVKPDASLSEGRGYYQEIFNNGQGEDADLAWSRLSKTKPTIVELAFKNTLTGGEKGKFIWLPWANADLLDWSLFEYNDHFTLEQAGYPLKEDTKNYPIKAVWGVDNTCRVASGYVPNGYMPGLCPNYEPGVTHHTEKECPPCGIVGALCPPC